MAASILKISCECGKKACNRALHAQGDRNRKSVSIAVTDGPGSLLGHIRIHGSSVRTLAAWLLDVPESLLPGAPAPRKREKATAREDLAPWQC